MDRVDQGGVAKSREFLNCVCHRNVSLCSKDLMCNCAIVFQYLYNFHSDDLWPNERNYIRTFAEYDHAFVVTFIKNLNQLQKVSV